MMSVLCQGNISALVFQRSSQLGKTNPNFHYLQNSQISFLQLNTGMFHSSLEHFVYKNRIFYICFIHMADFGLDWKLNSIQLVKLPEDWKTPRILRLYSEDNGKCLSLLPNKLHGCLHEIIRNQTQSKKDLWLVGWFAYYLLFETTIIELIPIFFFISNGYIHSSY